MDTFNINRRGFIKSASASFALAALGWRGLDAIFQEKNYRVALIGTGWYGKSDLFRLIQVAPIEVVALCDVDTNMLNEAGKMVSMRQKSGKVPRLYKDYRKMLSENELDIVLIGTPDHWHALTAIEAMKHGAHVYVQKPISVDVLEGEAMVAAARKYQRVVQVGTQRRSTPHLMDAKKILLTLAYWAKLPMRKCVATSICAITAILLFNPFRRFLIMRCGPVPRRCAPLMDCHTCVGGAHSWNMETE